MTDRSVAAGAYAGCNGYPPLCRFFGSLLPPLAAFPGIRVVIPDSRISLSLLLRADPVPLRRARLILFRLVSARRRRPPESRVKYEIDGPARRENALLVLIFALFCHNIPPSYTYFKGEI
jgi:hypothetical protein